MRSDLPTPTPVKTLQGVKPGQLSGAILDSIEPLILKGFGSEWPMVKAGESSSANALRYLEKFYSGIPITTCYGEPDTRGRVFYNPDMTGFNFISKRQPLQAFIQEFLTHCGNPNPPTLYIPSTDITRWFPDLDKENSAQIDELDPIKLIWVGNRTRIAAHYDFPKNIACCIAGRRRFTLFPPAQVKNLYPGPLEFAPGGQEISLVDFDHPDLEKFPRFREAMACAQVAELEPGDALFLPGMWWHHVEGLDDINILYTHWWRDSPAFLGRPTNAMLLAILSLRNLSEEQRNAWRELFDYYVFNPDVENLENIPPAARAMLELPLSELEARKLRAELLKRLNI